MIANALSDNEKPFYTELFNIVLRRDGKSFKASDSQKTAHLDLDYFAIGKARVVKDKAICVNISEAEISIQFTHDERKETMKENDNGADQKSDIPNGCIHCVVRGRKDGLARMSTVK